MHKKLYISIIALFIAGLSVGVAFQKAYGGDSLDEKINMEALRKQIGLKVTVYLTKGDKKAGKLIEITDQYLVLNIRESIFYSKEHKISFSEIEEIRDAQGNPINIKASAETQEKDTSKVNIAKQPERISPQDTSKPQANASKETTIVKEPSIDRLFSIIDSLKAEKKQTVALQERTTKPPKVGLKADVSQQSVKNEQLYVKEEKKAATPAKATVVTQPVKDSYSEEPRQKRIGTPEEKASLVKKLASAPVATDQREQRISSHLKPSRSPKIRTTAKAKSRTQSVAAPPRVIVSPQASSMPAAAHVLENLKNSIDGFNNISRRFTLIIGILSVSFVSLIAVMLLRRQSDFSAGRNEMTQLPFRVIKVREDYAIVDEGSHGGLEEGEILLVKRRGVSGLHDIGLAQAVIVLDNRSGIQLIEKLTDSAFHLGDIIYKIGRRRRRSLTKALLEKSKIRQLKTSSDLVPIVAKSAADYSHQQQGESLPTVAISGEGTPESDTFSDYLPVPPSDVKKGVKVKGIVYPTE